MPHHLSILVWVPAAAALAIAGLGARRVQLQRGLAIVSASLTAVIAGPLWFAFQPRGAEWQFVERLDVAPSIGASYLLGIDGFSLALILGTAIAGLAAVVSAVDRAGSWYAAVLGMHCASFGVILSLDLLLWLAFVVLLLVTTAFLLSLAGPPARSALWIWTATFAAGALIAAAVVLVHAFSGASSFDLRALRQGTMAPGPQVWTFVAFVLGFTIAAAVLSFHKACSILVLNAGVYAFIRIGLPVLPDASRRFAVIVMVIGVAGALAAALRALAQTEWKRLAAYASLSQIGVALAGAGALTPAGITGGMVLASVPGFGGVAGARSIVEGIWQVNRVLAAFAAVSMIVVAVAIVRACWRTLGGRDWRLENLALHHRGVRAPLAFAALVVLWAAIGLHSAPLLSRLETSVARVVLRVSPEYAADVADCLSQPPPPPAVTGLPPGVVMAAPCAEGTQPGDLHKK